MFSMEFLSGILAYPLMSYLGMMPGIIIAMIPFLIGIITTNAGYRADERDLQLIHRTDSYHIILVAVAMALIYLYFPGINWFFSFIAAIGIFRGVCGICIFILN